MELSECTASEPIDVLPALREIEHARASLLKILPSSGAGLEEVERHVRDDLVPGFNRPSKSSSYYGFVTGQPRQLCMHS